MKSIVDKILTSINESSNSSKKMQKDILACKNFKDLMKYLDWDEEIARQQVLDDENEELDDRTFNNLMNSEKNKITCEILKNDPNYSHYVEIDGKYGFYLDEYTW